MGAPVNGHEVRGVFTLSKPPQAKLTALSSSKPRDVGQSRTKWAVARGRREKRERVFSILRIIVNRLEVADEMEVQEKFVEYECDS
jgi:hypothetical protein